jgi:nucleoside-diphosphate-sugar epimerase
MRYFITGAGGFLGSNVLHSMVEAGEEHIAVLLRPGEDPWRILDLLPRVRMFYGDLEDQRTFDEAFEAFAPDAVIHLAWKGVFGGERNDAAQVDNIGASLDLVKLAGRCGVKRFVGLGSQAEYGPCSARLDEQTPTRPTTLYGAAKLAVCVTAERLCELLGVGFAWIRVFSTYGPGDHPQWMIPYLIDKLLDGERPSLTAGEQLWDYLYAADAGAAIYAVARTPAATGVFNLGSGRPETLRRTIEMARDMIDPSLPLGFGEVPYRPDQVMHLEANIARLQAATGWAPRVSLAEGLAKTVEWRREQRAGRRA